MLHIVFTSLLLFVQSVLVAQQGISLAGTYQKNSALQWEWATESLDRFSFYPNDKILDVGCGDGKITALIARRVPQGIIIGMDISEKMINQATLTFGHENLIFFQGDALTIPFRNQFDKVVSFCTLHWVLDQKQALHSMKRCLKPDGILLLVLPGHAPNNLATLSEKVAKSEKWSEYFPFLKQERVYFTLEEYRKLLAEVGLEIRSIMEAESVTLYESKNALIDWLTPLVNFIDHLPRDLQPLFIEDISDQMLLNDPPYSDGSIGIRHLKIEVVASKT